MVDKLPHFNSGKRISNDEYIFCTNKNQKVRYLFHRIVAIVMWHSAQPISKKNFNIILVKQKNKLFEKNKKQKLYDSILQGQQNKNLNEYRKQ